MHEKTLNPVSYKPTRAPGRLILFEGSYRRIRNQEKIKKKLSCGGRVFGKTGRIILLTNNPKLTAPVLPDPRASRIKEILGGARRQFSRKLRRGRLIDKQKISK